MVPRVQKGRVEWTGGLADWMGPERRETFVFVVSGRNVAPGRLRRCIESMARQKGFHWGAVLFDDASEPGIAEHFEIACTSLGARCTVVRNRRRRGLLANMVTAVRMICTDPETVIVTLDADDVLIGDRVLERLAAEYERGADVTVGSMLRTDKAADYPVCFDRPREWRGGNVWQHLRSFRKRLFDAVPDEALRLDGDYVDIATDWAFMLPIVEMAARPVHVVESLWNSTMGSDSLWSSGDGSRRCNPFLPSRRTNLPSVSPGCLVRTGCLCVLSSMLTASQHPGIAHCRTSAMHPEFCDTTPELDIADGDDGLHSGDPRRSAESIAGFRFA